jgi:hypothetical protein
MTNPTTPFNWQMPQSTDLVTDLPADFETFGQAVATSMADLLGGTTGQILSKASNTDMDFTWVTNDVGDITAVTAGTGITGGGTSGAVTVSFDQANFGGGQYAAGKNKVINGDFGIWQRGTSFTLGVGDVFTADRYRIGVNGSSLGTNTVSQQTFTPGSAPVAGYEGQYFLRVANTSAGSGMTYFASDNCWIEDVRNFAGQTVTLSFWAKSNASRTMAMDFYQIFGTGGSSPVQTSITSANLTTSWTRFSVTFAVPSVSGKTIGAGSCSFIRMYHPQNATFQFDIWGLQIESGSTATPFQTATGNPASELAACQRYYWRNTSDAQYGLLGAAGFVTSSTNAQINLQNPVPMRTSATSIDFLNVLVQDANSVNYVPSSGGIDSATNTKFGTGFNFAITGATTGRFARLLANNTTNAYIGVSAEL